MGDLRPIRVILIDDHRRVHEAASAVLASVEDIELVAQGSNGQEAIDLCQEYQPDLLLMDVVMPVLDGIAATRIIHEKFPQIRILILSSFQDHESVHTMLRNGASGYISKGAITQDLITTIRATNQGQVVLSPEIANLLLSPPAVSGAARPRQFNLTARELEVLGLMAEGLNLDEIAVELTVSRSTIKFHANNILLKMGVETRSEALVLAAKNNLI
jgi:NarL family two-component system response regulator LiaR